MLNPTINVLQLISSLEVGGAEKLLLDLLASRYEDDPVQFTVVVMNQSVSPEMRERLQSLGMTVYFFNRPESHLHYKYLFKLLKIIRNHRIHIVHSHNWGSKLWAMLCKLCRPGLKVVFTVHDTVPATYSAVQRFLHRTFIDRHIAISGSVKALCDREGFVKTTQIYNGIDLKPFQHRGRLSLVQRLAVENFQSWPMRIVQVGRMYYPKKGQDVLIEAVRLCREAGMNVHATLMGGVYAYSEESFRELQQRVASLGLQNHIEFLVNRTDVPEVLATADLFVLASRYEGLGLVVLEAMAAGVPVIASNIDGPAELIEDNRNGFLFESGDSNQLFQKISMLYENPARADEVAGVAAETVLQFDIQTMKTAYYRLYESLLPDWEATNRSGEAVTLKSLVGEM